MRVLLDANVLARAATGPPGLANQLVIAAARHEHSLLLSPFLVAELSRVLRYPRLLALHGLDDAGINQYIADLVTVADMVLPPGDTPAVVADDPDDDPVIAAAVAGQADVICTKDRHLHTEAVVAYCRRRRIQVLDDVPLLDLLR